MSDDPDKEIANVGDGGGDVNRSGGGDNEEGCGGVVARGDEEKREKGYRRDLRKAKQVVLFPFRKAKKKLCARNKNKNNNNNKRYSLSSAPAAASESYSGKRVGCYMCFTQPPTSEESPGTAAQTSDPNSPRFTLEGLKALIEKNDFYSKECNPHIDIFSSISD